MANAAPLHWIDPWPSNAAEMLSAALDTAPDPSASYALLDLAFAPELTKRLRRLVADNALLSLYANIYDGPDLEAIAPQMLVLPQELETRHELLQTLLRITSGRPMLSVIATSTDAHTLRQHLQRQLEACTPDGKAWMLRLADTRSLTALLEVFSHDQRNRLLAGIEQWHYFARDGQLISITGNTGLQDEPATAPYEFDVMQQQRLQQLALPDALLFNIVRRPDLFGRLQASPSVAHACIVSALAELPNAASLHDATLYSSMMSALTAQGLMIGDAG